MCDDSGHRACERIWYLGLGSNVGDREQHLHDALKSLDSMRGSTVLRTSSIYETDPWGETDQGAFLNMVAEVSSDLDPHVLLAEVKRIECALGRQARRHWGPREIDIDLLAAGDLRIRTDDLIVPHPLILDRQFVLIPLADLAPGLRVEGVGPVSEHVVDDGSVRRIGAAPKIR